MSYSISDRNEDFVNFAAAFAGHISPNFRAIDFNATDASQFRCKVVLRVENAEDRRSIAEALEDFEAMRRPLYEQAYHMDCHVLVSTSSVGHPAADELRLFAARED